MKVSDFLSATGATAKSVAKILLQSRRPTIHSVDPRQPLLILANGPGLRSALDQQMDILRKFPAMAVNFFANSPEFRKVRPAYYVLADPYFFSGSDDARLRQLHAELASADWPMTLLIPVRMSGKLPSPVRANSNLKVQTFNAVGAEGFQWFERMAYGTRLAMPRPRNVLIPSIMCGMALGFQEIYLLGADHSWMHSIYVDKDNNVVSIQPHFYKDNEKERQRVLSEYRGYRLHDIVYSFYVAFRAYHRIAAYASAKGVRIFNATEGSCIDAFPKVILAEKLL